jgi:protein CrcB
VAYETSRDAKPGELPSHPDLEPADDARLHSRSRGRRSGPRLPSRPRLGVLAAIAGGGALGGGARYLIEEAAPVRAGAFPWATFSINVAGAFALALLLVFILDVWPPTRYLRPFAAVGFLGAFTTFSTWMVETAELLAHSARGLATAYVAGSLLAGLAAVSLGLVLGRSLLARRARAASPEEG